MAAVDLSVVYHRYIDALNSGDIDSLNSYVHQHVIHNGKQIGLEGYRDMIRDNITDFPGLQFKVEILVVSKDHVAARLRITFRPVKRGLNPQPSDKEIVLPEHVFYQFEQDKIKEVWSMLDRKPMEEQSTSAQS